MEKALTVCGEVTQGRQPNRSCPSAPDNLPVLTHVTDEVSIAVTLLIGNGPVQLRRTLPN